MSIGRVLIANRGEIAVRIIKACKELGIGSVAAVSEADRESLPAKMVDRAVCIGPPRPTDSYLKIDALICAALGTHCDAIHPAMDFSLSNQSWLRLVVSTASYLLDHRRKISGKWGTNSLPGGLLRILEFQLSRGQKR
jgi:acetyl/propionyl-CoA carboxylase alpha subunit